MHHYFTIKNCNRAGVLKFCPMRKFLRPKNYGPQINILKLSRNTVNG